MKLKHTKKLSNGQFEVILSVSNFSVLEVRAMKAIAEPNVVYNKTYGISGLEVNIDNIPITKFVNQKFILKGNVENIVDVALEAQYLVEDIREALTEIMAELVGEYEKLTKEMKFDQEEEVEIGPKHEYPEWKPSDEPSEEPDPGEEPQPETPDDKKCNCCDNCSCTIEIGEDIPEDYDDGKIFGQILPDEEDDEEEAPAEGGSDSEATETEDDAEAPTA